MSAQAGGAAPCRTPALGRLPAARRCAAWESALLTGSLTWGPCLAAQHRQHLFGTTAPEGVLCAPAGLEYRVPTWEGAIPASGAAPSACWRAVPRRAATGASRRARRSLPTARACCPGAAGLFDALGVQVGDILRLVKRTGKRGQRVRFVDATLQSAARASSPPLAEPHAEEQGECRAPGAGCCAHARVQARTAGRVLPAPPPCAALMGCGALRAGGEPVEQQQQQQQQQQADEEAQPSAVRSEQQEEREASLQSEQQGSQQAAEAEASQASSEREEGAEDEEEGGDSGADGSGEEAEAEQEEEEEDDVDHEEGEEGEPGTESSEEEEVERGESEQEESEEERPPPRKAPGKRQKAAAPPPPQQQQREVFRWLNSGKTGKLELL